MRITVALVLLMALACSSTTTITALPPSQSAPTTSVSPQAPKPKPAALVLRGNYIGECHGTGHADNTASYPHETIHWHVTVLNDDKLKMNSTSGGYTLVFDRTADDRFYGSGAIGDGWNRAYRLEITKADDKGMATKVVALGKDKLSQGAAVYWAKSACILTPA